MDEKTIQLEISNVNNQSLGDLNSLQSYIEDKIGVDTVVKGLGNLSSSVAELKPPQYLDSPNHIRGVVRLSQLNGKDCFVDGSLDGIFKKTQDYSLAIHDFGDLSSDNYSSIGDPIIELDKKLASETEQNIFQIRKVISNCEVPDMIGRSVALTEMSKQSGQQSRILSAGIIARASTVSGNKKQICTCSGKTIWEERVDRKKS